MTHYTDRAWIMRILQATHHMTAIDAAIMVANEPSGSLAQWGMELRIEHLALYGREFES